MIGEKIEAHTYTCSKGVVLLGYKYRQHILNQHLERLSLLVVLDIFLRWEYARWVKEKFRGLVFSPAVSRHHVTRRRRPFSGTRHQYSSSAFHSKVCFEKILLSQRILCGCPIIQWDSQKSIMTNLKGL